MLRQVADEEPRAPRKLDDAIPRDLETIVLKAMAKEPSLRYRSAQELADDLRRYLEHKPITARRPTAFERLFKWSRRHRLVVASSFVFLLFAVVILAASTMLIARQQREVAKQRDQARRQRHLAREAVDRMYTRFAQEWIAKQPRLEPVQREFLLDALRFYQDFSEDEAKDPVEIHGRAMAFRRVGGIQQSMDQIAAAEEAYRHSLELWDDLVARFPAVSEYRREQAHATHNLGELFLATGRVVESEQVFRRELTIRDALRDESSTVPDYTSELAKVHESLSRVLRSLGRFADSEHALKRSEELARSLVANHPGNVAYRTLLTDSLRGLGILMQTDTSGRTEAAEAYHKEAIEISESLLEEFPGDDGHRGRLLAGLNNLGNLYQRLNRYADSERPLRRAQQLAREAVAEFPNIPAHESRLAQVCSNLGIALKETGRLLEAEQAHREALLIARKQLANLPGTPAYHSSVAAYSANLANVLLKQGKRPEGRNLVEDAIDHERASLGANPRNPRFRQFQSNHFNILLGILEEPDDLDAARKVVEEWTVLLRVQDVIGGTSENARADAEGLTKLARVLATGNYPQLRDPRLAVQLAEKVAGWVPEDGFVWSTLGMARYRAGEWKAAIGALEKAVRLSKGGGPDDWLFLTMALWQTGDRDKARIWYDKAVQSQERDHWQDDELRRFRADAAALLGEADDTKPIGRKEGIPPQSSQP